MQKADKRLVQQAQMVLDFNWNGEYTNRDHASIPTNGRGTRRSSPSATPTTPRTALEEISHLFESQWNNGLLPQIVFNPRFGEYFPGIDFWHAERSPNAPRDSKTSGVVQPPIHATAVLYVYRHAQDEAAAKEFLGRLFPKLRAWHEYLYRERDPEGEGLVYIRHPWESGMDNSPMWDSIMERLQLRPEQIPQIPARRHALRLRRGQAAGRRLRPLRLPGEVLRRPRLRRGADKEGLPLPGAGCALQRAAVPGGQDLAEIAACLGEDPTPFEQRARKTARAMNEKLWDEEHSHLLGLRPRHGPTTGGLRRAELRAPVRGIPDEGRAASHG